MVLSYASIWKAHLRPWSGLPLFPRDMASRDALEIVVNGKKRSKPLTRSPLINEQQYLASINAVHKKKDTYIQVFSDWQIEKHIFDTIFFELTDAHPDNKKYYDNIEDAIPQIMLNKYIVDRKLESLGINYRCLFTGGRGFHYYLDFEPVYIRDYKATVSKFFNDIGLIDFIDTQVLEPARVARVPHCVHLKTGYYAVYTNGMAVDTILDASKHNSILIDIPKSLTDTAILDYLDLSIVNSTKSNNNTVYANRYTDWYPDCVIAIIEKILVNQHATHDERKHLAGYLMRFNLDEDEILEYFKNTSDYNRDVALQQLRSLAGYSGYSCRNIKALMRDLCPGTCAYIRNVARRRKT